MDDVFNMLQYGWLFIVGQVGYGPSVFVLVFPFVDWLLFISCAIAENWM